jgi:ribosomal protein L11 methyltransferase
LPPPDALDRLIALGALDAEQIDDGVAAILPDGITIERLSRELDGAAFTLGPAAARDDGSVWILRPRPVQVGGLTLAPAAGPEVPGALRLVDGAAFGTGLHPTTALCLEHLDDLFGDTPPERVLDIGIGSGVLALAALLKGVRDATGVDIDPAAIADSAENARLNGLAERLTVVTGGPEAVEGAWPLVLANVLAAPLIDMAPTVVRRVGHRGRLLLSGVHESMAADVERTYLRLGMRRAWASTRDHWTAIVLDAGW